MEDATGADKEGQVFSYPQKYAETNCTCTRGKYGTQKEGKDAVPLPDGMHLPNCPQCPTPNAPRCEHCGYRAKTVHERCSLCGTERRGLDL